MQIYPYKIHGGGLNGNDINEINNLNHYIGMKKIEQADFTEMQLMPFMFGVFILLALRAVVFGEMKSGDRSFRPRRLFRRLLHRRLLLPPLLVRAQFGSARAGPYSIVHAAHSWNAKDRQLYPIKLPGAWARICSGFSWRCSSSRFGFHARGRCQREAWLQNSGERTRLACRFRRLAENPSPRKRSRWRGHHRPHASRVRSPSSVARTPWPNDDSFRRDLAGANQCRRA